MKAAAFLNVPGLRVAGCPFRITAFSAELRALLLSQHGRVECPSVASTQRGEHKGEFSPLAYATLHNFVAGAPLATANAQEIHPRVCRYTFHLVFVLTVASESCVGFSFRSKCAVPM